LSNGNRRFRRLAAAGILVGGIFTVLPSSPASASHEPARSTAEACPPDQVPDQGFTDLPSGSDEVSVATRLAVNCGVEYGIARGTSPTTFNPSGSISRAQTATMAMQKLDQVTAYERPANAPDAFTDDDGVHEDNINDAAAEGIIVGTSPGLFDPSGNVSRDQMATIVLGQLETAGATLPAVPADDGFTDVDCDGVDPDNAHCDGIAILHELGIFTGSGNNVFGSGSDLSRAQMMFVETRVVALLIEQGLMESVFAPPSDAGVIVVDCDGTDFTFVPDGGDEPVEVEYDEDDSFFVDGNPATIGAFNTACSVGDRVEVADNGDGTLTISLTNQDPPDEGTIGNLETDDAGGFANTYAVIDPVTGIQLSGFINYVDTCDFYEVDGALATLATFEADLNEGDALAREDAGAGNETCSLTNNTVSGTVDDLSTDATPAAAFRLGVFGDSFDDLTQSTGTVGTLDGHFLADPGYDQEYMVDGEEATLTEFVAAISEGDSGTYERLGGIELFTLVNAAPSTVSGTATEEIVTGSDTFDLLPEDSDTRETIDYSGTSIFFVDGALATEAEFEAAYTAGDSVSFTPGDVPTDTDETVALSNDTLAGLVDDVDLPNVTYDVENAAGGIIFDDLDYTAGVFGGADLYFVDGTEVVEDDFETALNECGAPGDDDECTITVVDGINTEHRLAT